MNFCISVFFWISGRSSGTKRATGDPRVLKQTDFLGLFSYLRVFRGLSSRRAERMKSGPKGPPTRSRGPEGPLDFKFLIILITAIIMIFIFVYKKLCNLVRRRECSIGAIITQIPV